MATKEKLFTINGQSRSAREWGRILGVDPGTIRERARSGRNIAAPSSIEAVQYTCPISGMKLSTTQWAIYLGIDKTSFRKRLTQWGVNNPRTFARPMGHSDPNNELLHRVAKRKGQLFCRNPFTGESMLAWEWAKHYGVSLAEINKAINDYGRNSRQLYRHLESRKV